MRLKALTDSTRVEITCALAAGLCVSGLDCLLSAVDQEHSFDLRHCVRSVLTSVASYAAVALLLRWCWTGLLKRMIPIWIPIAILGTALLMGIMGVYVGIHSWRSPQRVEQTLAEFIAVQMKDLQSLFIVVCVISLPVTATVYYAKSIIKAVWHHGAEKPPSILGNQRT